MIPLVIRYLVALIVLAAIDDSGVTVDATMQLGEQAETVNVTETEADVQT